MPTRFHHHGCSALLACLCGLSVARAHEPGLSTLDITATAAGGGALELQLSSRDAALLHPAADSTGDGLIDPMEAAAHADGLSLLLPQWARVQTAGGEQLELTELAVGTREGDVVWRASIAVATDPRWQLELPLLAKLSAAHRQYVTVHDPAGGILREDLLRPALPMTRWTWPDPTAPASAPARAADSRFGNFFVMGVEHILIGFDHLLFLAALLLGVSRMGQAIAIITSFTVAHSITLGLAAMDVVAVPGNWVEPLIAASIVFVAGENLWRRHEEPRARWVLTFVFGLVHGFGFAGVLRELGLGQGGADIVAPLLGFNLGVEAGQFALAALALPLLTRARRDRRFQTRISPALSAIVMAMGAYWLVERTLL